MSSNMNGWKYDVMKLESRKPVDIEQWQLPVRLNRKELRREDPNESMHIQEAVGPMLGLDGKPVIGADGKMVMVDADGKPIHAHSNNGEGSSSKTAKEKAVGGRKKFQKKTKQVYLVPEATRLLRREERYPWVLEDSSGSQVWNGMLEDLEKAETHAMFLPTSDNTFKFAPPHRWYKFQKRPSHKVLSLEEAEKLVSIVDAMQLSNTCYMLVNRWHNMRNRKTPRNGCPTAQSLLQMQVVPESKQRNQSTLIYQLRSLWFTPQVKVTVLVGENSRLSIVG